MAYATDVLAKIENGTFTLGQLRDVLLIGGTRRRWRPR